MNSSGNINRGVVPSRQAVFNLRHHLALGVALHQFVGQRRAGDVAAMFLQLPAAVGVAAYGRVQAEALQVGEEAEQAGQPAHLSYASAQPTIVP